MRNSLKTLLFSLIVVFYSCDNDPLTTPATITTDAVSNITFTTVDCGGMITSNGGTAITNRGLVWSTNPNPTINDNIVVASTNTFGTTITGLENNTTYYVRAVAVNSDGESYGNEEVFTTWKLDNTKWEFRLNYGSSNSNYPGDVDFFDNGTTQWEEPDYPGLYTTYGTWSVDADTVTYYMAGDPTAVSYVFTGTVVNGDTMSGTFTWGSDPDKTFTATKYP